MYKKKDYHAYFITRIYLNMSFFVFCRSDGSFTVTNVPSGSYVVEVVNPTYVFEPARIDITSKGKIRARKVDNIQNSKFSLTYPLKMKSRGMASYFQSREQWRITDFLFSPMVCIKYGMKIY